MFPVKRGDGERTVGEHATKANSKAVLTVCLVYSRAQNANRWAYLRRARTHYVDCTCVNNRRRH